jgi:hypothetical protein
MQAELVGIYTTAPPIKRSHRSRLRPSRPQACPP